MNRTASNSLLHSLKGKIWLATSGLAFFISVFGLISYLIVSLLTDDPFYAVFIPFLVLAFAVMVFGWWLSNEVVSPIEKVTLLAKSLERSATISLPKTLGSYEVDELLQTLHRNSRQTHRIVGLMDEVANGNINVALSPLENSDRLTVSFQQLLVKVSESIHAKQDLEKLQTAIKHITDEIYIVRNGDLTVKINSDFSLTKEISDTLKYLISHLNEVTIQIKSETKQTRESAANFQQMISNLIERDETRVQEMNQAAVVLQRVPNEIQKICEDLADSAASANRSIEKARLGSRSAQDAAAAVGQIRKQIQEAIKQTQKLAERSEEIDKMAVTIGDLAHRTKMIALNAALQTDGESAGGKNPRIAVIAEEIGSLATRADNMNKHISAFSKSIASEINQAETVLRQSISEAANLSKFALETGNSLSELERYINQFLNLQNKLAASTREQTAETQMAFQTFAASISETENAIENLKNSNSSVAEIFRRMENLRRTAADFTNAKTSAENSAGQKNVHGEFSPHAEINFALEER